MASFSVLGLDKKLSCAGGALLTAVHICSGGMMVSLRLMPFPPIKIFAILMAADNFVSSLETSSGFATKLLSPAIVSLIDCFSMSASLGFMYSSNVMA